MTVVSAQPDSATSAATASVTFCTGVESGAIETMLLCLVQSIRRWGGKLKDAPFVAVKPRFGPPLKKNTLREFEKLNITFRNITPTHGMPWFVWMNKPTTLLAAEAEANTDTIAWLDADMLVINEPTELMLRDDEDFAACAADKNAGTTGPADEFEPYWAEVCRQMGLRVEELPWVITEREKARIRIYFNAGLFAYRRSTGFGQKFMDYCRQILLAKVKSKSQGIVLTDQVVLGLTAIAMGLRWKPIGRSYNYAIGAKLHKAKLYDPADIASVKILHYHDAMWPSFRPQFLNDLRTTRPDVADWLATLPPLSNDFSLPSKVMHKVLGTWRKKQYLRHEAACKPF